MTVALRSLARRLAPTLAVVGVVALRPAIAEASEPELTWRMAPPTLRLQPESARLVLNLPVEWMPPPDPGLLGIPFDPNKSWEFRGAHQLTRASIGAGLRLQIEDRSRSIRFGVSILPRAAVAVLRFDPALIWLR